MIWAVVTAGAVGGAIVGSYLATICIRWPAGKQAAAGRSSCDHCSRTLSPAELVPIVSALLARGRCRSCGEPIATLHLAVEIMAAGVAATALALQPNINGLALAIFWLLLIAPAILDARHFWLPDVLTAVLAAAGLMLGGLATGVGLPERVLGGVLGFLALGLVGLAYSKLRGRSGLGAGDPKLLGAIGLWTGWAALPFILVIASVSGLALALAQRRGATDRMPFGTLLAVGAMLWTGFAAYQGTPAF